MGKELSENFFEPLTSIDDETSKWLNRIKQAVLIVDENGLVLFQNTASLALLNYPENHQTPVKFSDIEPTINTQDYLKGLFEKLDQEYEASGKWIDQSGCTIYVNYKVSVYNSHLKLLSFFFEIAPNPLSNEKLLKEIMNTTHEGIFIVDTTNDAIIDCNERAVALFEYENKEQLLKIKGRELQKEPYSQTQINEITNQIKQTGTWSQEIEYRSQKGKVFWCLIEAKLIKLGQTSLFLVRFTDIDHKKKAEETLNVINKRYQDLVLYNQALLCMHDIDGTIQSINPASYKSLGYSSAEELIGQNLKIIFEPKNYEAFSYYINEINTKGRSNGVMQVVGKDGRKMYWLYNNYKVDEPGTHPYVVGTAQDITERIYAEKELKKAKEFAERSLKAREMFLANVSHELRTPLHGILNINNFLSKTKLKPNQLEYTKIINQSAENLLFLVNDILDIAKMESGQFQLEPVAFDLYDVVHGSVEAFKFKAISKNLKFNLKFPTVPIETLRGDSNRLAQVISNLLSNAIKFTHQGEVSLIVDIIANTTERILIEIKVVDTGIGIPKEKHLYMFQNYSQLHENKGVYGGTGLGLSICRKLLEAQQGYLYCSSTEGKGSEFGFIISYEKAPSRKKRKKSTHLQPSSFDGLKNLRILLVEDNPVNQLICKSLLKEKGIEPDLAEDGATALELACTKLYDLILMDIMLPDIGGKEVTTIIRGLADKTKSEVPILALTANAMKGDSEIYLKAGMNDYLSKPYTEEELFMKIAETLNILIDTKENEEEIPAQDIANKTPEIFDPNRLKKMIADDHSIIQEYLKNYGLDYINTEIESLKKAITNQNITEIGSRLNNIKLILVEIYNEKLDQLTHTVEEQIEFGIDFHKIVPNMYKMIALLEQIVIRLNQVYLKQKK